MTNFDENLKSRVKMIDKKLDEYVKMGYPKQIYEAARYSLLGGGKRLRPVILLGVCEMFGGETADAMPFACALEMIHCYSLIHDDLPAMDNDDLRRGMPTSHVKFGEAMAILAGDALLNRAYEVMAAHIVQRPEMRFAKAMSKIAEFAGMSGMIGGQVKDILSEKRQPDENALNFIHTNKAAKLFMAAFAAGALCAGRDADVARMENIGFNLGLAFQLKDDLLDVAGDVKQLGKPIGSDEKNKKITYIALHGADAANERYLALANGVRNMLKKEENSEFLTELANRLIDRVK